jgi:hypothetical protein
MATLIALAAIGVFAAGIVAGVIGVVSVAIRREERNLTLTSEAPGHLAEAGRWLNGVHVRAPRRSLPLPGHIGVLRPGHCHPAGRPAASPVPAGSQT